MLEIKNFIAGEYVPSSSNEWLDCINPATEEVFAKITNSNEDDVEKAIHSAKKAFPAWSALSNEERGEKLKTLSRLIEENLEELAIAESMDNGKPVSVAMKVDIPRSAANFSFFAHYIEEFNAIKFESDDSENYVFHNPLGVVACISPWNLPLYLLTWKLAPALIVGNTVIAKPSELTPMTAHLLGELTKQAQIPDGVVNIIHGEGSRVGEKLCSHKDVKAISFTGSTATGRVINKLAAPHFKKVSLEMGGKNATVVFSDADIDHALNESIRSGFSNQGQICLCGSRLYVQNEIYETFKAELVARVSELVVGNPNDENTQQGSLVSKAHQEKVLSYIEKARGEGASILCGGKAFFEKGFYVEPTIIEGLKHNSACIQEEIFGPVVSLIPFDTEEEAIALANDCEYGLAGSVFTRDLEKAKRVCEHIHTGMIWINTWMKRDLRIPFGGVKSSGLGREGGKYALSFFTETKTITRELKHD